MTTIVDLPPTTAIRLWRDRSTAVPMQVDARKFTPHCVIFFSISVSVFFASRVFNDYDYYWVVLKTQHERMKKKMSIHNTFIRWKKKIIVFKINYNLLRVVSNKWNLTKRETCSSKSVFDNGKYVWNKAHKIGYTLFCSLNMNKSCMCP